MKTPKPEAQLEEPECQLGYPMTQVERILGPRWPAFQHWFNGQTASLCEGRCYCHEHKTYHPSNCGPHGEVVYTWDLEGFLAGAPPLD